MPLRSQLVCLTGEEIEDAREDGRVFSHRSACPQCRRTAEVMRMRNDKTGEDVDLCCDCTTGLSEDYRHIGWLVTDVNPLRGRKAAK